MGAIHFGIDKGLVDRLRGALPLATFVETGTFEGDSVAGIAGDFTEVYSIESAESYHRKAVERFGGVPHVRLLFGDSPEMLRQLHATLADRPVLYWLDAHWCLAEDETAGRLSQCPLLAEIDAIGTLNEQSVVLIDDARLFLAPPPLPHEASDWPVFDSIVRKLLAASPRHRLMVLNDVIVFYPIACEQALHDYARHASFDLLAEMHRSRHLPKVEEQRRQAGLDRDRLASESSQAQQALAARGEELSALQRALDVQREETAASRVQVSLLQRALDVQREETAASRVQVSLLQRALDVQREETAASRVQVSLLQRALDTRREEVAALQQRASRLERALSEIEASRWYRGIEALKTGLARLGRRRTAG